MLRACPILNWQRARTAIIQHSALLLGHRAAASGLFSPACHASPMPALLRTLTGGTHHNLAPFLVDTDSQLPSSTEHIPRHAQRLCGGWDSEHARGFPPSARLLHCAWRAWWPFRRSDVGRSAGSARRVRQAGSSAHHFQVASCFSIAPPPTNLDFQVRATTTPINDLLSDPPEQAECP